MTTMMLFSPPILKFGSLLANPSSTTPRTDAHTSSIRSFACSCGPSASSSYSPQQTSFRGTSLTGTPARSCMSQTRRARSSVRAVQNSSTSTDTEERLRVKQELLNILEQTDGSITPECMELIETLQKLNPNPEPSEVPELVNGCFQTVKSTLKGRAASDAGVFASIFTLGRAAFGVFKPLKQEVIISENYNHVRHAKEDEYTIASDISIKNNDGESPEYLEGYLVNQGRCNFVPDSKKITVAFQSSVLRPKDGVNEAELRSWKQLFQEENPSMDERGWMSAKLPEVDGDLDHLYLDVDLRIVRGNFKNIFVLRRLSGPAIPI